MNAAFMAAAAALLAAASGQMTCGSSQACPRPGVALLQREGTGNGHQQVRAAAGSAAVSASSSSSDEELLRTSPMSDKVEHLEREVQTMKDKVSGLERAVGVGHITSEEESSELLEKTSEEERGEGRGAVVSLVMNASGAEPWRRRRGASEDDLYSAAPPFDEDGDDEFLPFALLQESSYPQAALIEAGHTRYAGSRVEARRQRQWLLQRQKQKQRQKQQQLREQEKQRLQESRASSTRMWQQKKVQQRQRLQQTQVEEDQRHQQELHGEQKRRHQSEQKETRHQQFQKKRKEKGYHYVQQQQFRQQQNRQHQQQQHHQQHQQGSRHQDHGRQRSAGSDVYAEARRASLSSARGASGIHRRARQRTGDAPSAAPVPMELTQDLLLQDPEGPESEYPSEGSGGDLELTATDSSEVQHTSTIGGVRDAGDDDLEPPDEEAIPVLVGGPLKPRIIQLEVDIAETSSRISVLEREVRGHAPEFSLEGQDTGHGTGLKTRLNIVEDAVENLGVRVSTLEHDVMGTAGLAAEDDVPPES